MYVNHNHSVAKLSNMDLFSAEFYYSPVGDHVLPNNDLTMYAASPNSLYLYDQERNDMQNLGNTQCFSSTRVQTKLENVSNVEDFDLNPQYENNYELVANVVTESSDVQQNSNFSSLSAQNQIGRNSNVTLTELNMSNESESFLDDLDSVIPKTVPFTMDMNSRVQQSSFQNTSIQRQNTAYLPSTSSGPFSNYSQFIKSESMTSSSVWSNPCQQAGSLHDFTSTLPKVKSVPLSQICTSTSNNSSTLYELLGRSENNMDENKSSLHKLLMIDPPTKRIESSVLKRSAPPVKEEDDDSVEEKWKEIEKYIHDEEEEEDIQISRCTREKRKRYDSGSSFTLSFDESNDEDDDDSSDEEWSDTDMDMTSLNSVSVLDDGKKGEKCFWQYNVQSKGPKGTKLKLYLDSKNPYKLTTFEDPVFDPHNTKAGIRHGGKARKGDGNDIVPSPKKLFSLGQQIRKLNHMINEISSNNDQPSSIRNEMRKRKNKLASRACRLKKKAQHEANKVKLYGMEKEHSQLLQVIKDVRTLLINRAIEMEDLKDMDEYKVINKLDNLIATHLTTKIAGNAAVFVNSVIKAVENGDVTGGIIVNKKLNRK